ncbi:LysR family transcriptional regulator [Vibrio ulleungensis]|uniref:LysR family transcriptional regulator n=1 Tax=Vibrio ulleungensis TaxID=2807619 RepID=A0ABS2HEP7_9VIBR|nr:LysR family transcriptional regulator [Vibrio ulleungensis]MBM7035561.1 LysR family transcriptional regulator [Vibrio ulleungensis]
MKSEIDLNLLKILPLLYQHKKLKAVAKLLDKSEASVSKYLARLREQFDDPLFFLDPHTGYEPTPLLLEILPQLESGLDHLNKTLTRRPFVPEHYSKPIVLALPQFSQYYAGHRVIKIVREHFPHSPLTIVSWDEDTPQKILQGQIDLGFHFFNEGYPKALYQKPLGKIKFAIVIPERLCHLPMEDVYGLPFILPQATGWSAELPFKEIINASLDGQFDIVAQVDNITSVLNTVNEIGGATIMTSIDRAIPGFYSIDLDIPIEQIPPSCAMYCNRNRYSAFHQHLTNILLPLFPFQTQ